MHYKKIAYKEGDLFEMLTFDENQKIVLRGLKKLKKHEFHFLKLKTSKNMNFTF